MIFLKAKDILSRKLTVIITASFVRSHPSIRLVLGVLKSLDKININQCHIILAHDFSDNRRYEKYFERLLRYCSDHSLTNVTIVRRDDNGKLVGNIRYAFPHVDTKWLLVLQHDFPFCSSFDIEKVIEDMENNSQLKMVRFPKEAVDLKPTAVNKDWDLKNKLFGKQLQCKNFTYTRTPSWSDNNHLCESKYYRDIVLVECRDGSFMEETLNPLNTENTHSKYGTYIFGSLKDGPCIEHTDGYGTLRYDWLTRIYQFTKSLERRFRRFRRR